VLGIKVCRGHLVEPRHRVGLPVLGSNSTNLGETAIIVRWRCTAVHLMFQQFSPFPERVLSELGTARFKSQVTMLL
jgi:hypothetical protein